MRKSLKGNGSGLRSAYGIEEYKVFNAQKKLKKINKYKNNKTVCKSRYRRYWLNKSALQEKRVHQDFKLFFTSF